MVDQLELYRRSKVRNGKIPTSTKFNQALGAIPDTLRTFAFGTLLLFYYNQVLGLHASVASLAIAAGLIIDAVLDPLIGSWSDNLRSRLGRRHPFMYASAAPLALGLYLMFSPPPTIHDAALAAWLFVTVVLANVSMSFFTVPWTALYAELSDDYSERTQIVTWRFALGWLSALVFVFITWTLIFPSSPAFALGQLNPQGYRTFALVLAGTTFAAVIVTTRLTLREIPYLLQPTGPAVRFKVGRVVREVGLAFTNRDFFTLFLSALVSSGILGALTTLSIYLQTYFWGLSPEQLKWFGFAVFGAILAFFLVGPIERALDKKRVLLACFALVLIDGFVMIGLRLFHILPANGDPRLIGLLVVNEIGRTFLSTVVGIMFISMLADTLDLQELRTGRRQEGVFAAALTFSGKATAGVGGVIAGVLLEWVIHWPATMKGPIEPGLIVKLGIVTGILVPSLLLAPLLLIGRYTITREKHRATRLALSERRGSAMTDVARLQQEQVWLPQRQARYRQDGDEFSQNSGARFMAIDFEIPAEAKAIRERVRAWVQDECIPAEKALLAGAEYKPLLADLRKRARVQGLWCPFIPVEHGGMGLGPLANALVQMELGMSYLGALSMNTQGPDDATMMTLLEYGTDYQKETYLKPLLNGEKRICYSMTEKAAGADATGMRTTAVKDGNENYVLNGEKWFSSAASVADIAVVMARTDPEAPRHKQFSTFIVELPNPGYRIVRDIQTMAAEGPLSHILGGGHSEIEIKDLVIPAENLLGGEGNGFNMGQHRLAYGRLRHGMHNVAMAQRALDLATAHVTQRSTFGKPLSDRQGVQWMLADCASELYMARLMLLHIAYKAEKGMDLRQENSIAKVFLAHMVHKVVDTAIQLHGALGYSRDTPLAAWYTHIRSQRLVDGPDEVHRWTVGRNVIKAFERDGTTAAAAGGDLI